MVINNNKDFYILLHSTLFFSRPDIVSVVKYLRMRAEKLNEPIGFLVSSPYNLSYE